MFDQFKLFDGVEISELGLDKSARTMAHELVHTMGVSHDGQEGNYDCVGEYQRRTCAQKRPKVCSKPGTEKNPLISLTRFWSHHGSHVFFWSHRMVSLQ